MLPRKGVVQTVSSEGWSWIKRDGSGSRKSGNRVPFSMADVVAKVCFVGVALLVLCCVQNSL